MPRPSAGGGVKHKNVPGLQLLWAFGPQALAATGVYEDESQAGAPADPFLAGFELDRRQ